MTLLAKLNATAVKHPNAGCQLGAFMKTLTRRQAAEIVEAFASPHRTTNIRDELILRYGDAVPSYDTFLRHRKARCGC